MKVDESMKVVTTLNFYEQGKSGKDIHQRDKVHINIIEEENWELQKFKLEIE